MTTSATTGNLANPTLTGIYGTYPSASLSQYLDDYSVFSTQAPVASQILGAYGGYTPGINGGSAIANNYNYYNLMGINNDNMTSLQFKIRSNEHALGSYSEIMQKNLQEMAAAIREGEFGKASTIYNEIYTAISKNYGEELTTQSQRLEADQSIKATITKLYQQVNGYPLVNDIEESGEGFFENGFMQGFTLGNHHKNSAEETVSYMTGVGIENYSGKKFAKNFGKVVGGVVGVGGIGAAGALVGAGVAVVAGVAAAPLAIAGAAIAGVGALATWLFSDNKAEKVTEA